MSAIARSDVRPGRALEELEGARFIALAWIAAGPVKG
jgi:hypothetical protein